MGTILSLEEWSEYGLQKIDFVQYDITQSTNPDFDSSFSSECSGRINGCDQKNCYIYNDLIPRGPS